MAIASVIGTLVAVWGLAAARELAPATMPRLSEVHLDSTVLLFAAAVAAVATLLIGVLAAAQATRISLARRITEQSTSSLRSGFVVAEVALATGLTVLALLLVRSYLNLNAIDPGFHADGVLTAEVSLPAARYGSEGQRRAFFDELLHRAGDIQGVRTLGEVSHLPLGAVPSVTRFQAADSDREISAPFRMTSPGYFEALGIPILQGQLFAATADPRQIMVSDAFAARMWPGHRAIGQTLNLPNWEGMGALTVSGVVANVREELVSDEPVASVYLSTGLIRGGFGTLVIRFDGDPLVLSGRVADIVNSFDPMLPPPEVTTMEARLASVLALPRMQNRIFSSLSGLAVLLAVAGAYGVAHFSVSSRTRELGVRIAIGAAPARIVGMVLRETGIRVLVGVSIGIAGALYASRFVRGFLHGLEPTDPLSYALVALLLFGAGLLAAYFPARRAARVDPMNALRAD